MRKLLDLAFVSLIALLPCDADAKRWIAVVAPELRKAVEPLGKQRLAEGWDVTVLDASHDRAELIDNIAKLAQSDQQCSSCSLVMWRRIPPAQASPAEKGHKRE